MKLSKVTYLEVIGDDHHEEIHGHHENNDIEKEVLKALETNDAKEADH